MTFFGKTLVFLNLIFGIGAAVYSTSIYTNRPGWFEDLKDEPVAKGHAPINFAQLTKDITAQSNAATNANAVWSTNHKALEAAETDRGRRYLRMFGTNPDGTRPAMSKGLLDYAREGAPREGAPPMVGSFYNLDEDFGSKLLNLNPPAANIVKGPNDQPLGGTETLLEQFLKDAAAADGSAADSKKLRAQQKDLTEKIGVLQTRIYKQEEIRDNLLVEAARLDAFEVNATEHRGTVTRRRTQLIERLAPFRSLEKK